MATELQDPFPVDLESLSDLVNSQAHLVASIGDDALAQASLAATKALFDLGLQLEQKSHTHIQPFMVSIMEPPSVSLRSSTLAKSNAPPPPDPASVLPFTPLTELTVGDMEADQIWAQLELRNEGLGAVIKAVGAGEAAHDEDEDDSDEDDVEVEEDDSAEDMSVDDWKRMMAAEGYEEGDSEGDSDDESGEDDSSDDEDDGEDDGEDEDDEDELELASDDLEAENASDASDADALLGGSDDADDVDDDGDEDEVASESEDQGEDGVDADGGSDDEAMPTAGPSRKRHPTLDDQFFSIDAFNRMTEEQEAGRVSSGRLSGDDDDNEDDLGDLGALMLQEDAEDDAIMYGDFFESPRPAASDAGKRDGEPTGKRKRKGQKSARFEDSENEEPEMDEEEDAHGIFGRVKGDLFDDDDEPEEQNLSTHERRQQALAKQIAELEAEAIGPKDWQLLGEASARKRPENSLLEENLDFEHVAKVVPVITEEKVQSIEELIKTRIRDNNFDSPVRVRAYEPTPFLPSRFFELSDQQSTKSLAQIYEDEYQSAVAGGPSKDPRDEKLRKEHDEIDRLWGEICYKLDALSSLNFVPKQPKAQITTIENIATTSMESALPPSAAAATMLAPEEMFAPPTAGELVARTEQTPEEARRARGKARKVRKHERQRLGDMAQLHGKKKSSKEQKDEALKNLVKTGKGVTVVGKGDKETAKRKQRDETQVDAKRLKL